MKLCKERHVLVALCVAVLIGITAPVTMAASGSGGEPGGGCPTDQRLSFVPSPYLGTLTVQWVDGSVSYYADSPGVEQVGQNGCALVIPSSSAVPFSSAVELTDFQNTTAQDLKDTCVDIGVLEPFISPAGCAQGLFFQIVAANSLQFVDGDTFTVDVVMMQVELQ